MLSGYPDQCSSVSQWQLCWQRTSRLWSTTDGALKQPVQRWTIPVRQQRRQWQVCGNMKEGRTHEKQRAANPNTYIQYQVAPKNNAKQFTVPFAIPTEFHSPQDQSESEVLLPTQVTPIIVAKVQKGTSSMIATYDRENIRRHKPSAKHQMTRTIIKNQDFTFYLASTLDSWEAEILQYVYMKYNAFRTNDKMHAKLHAAGDGSVKYSYHGSFGWTINTSTGECLVRGFKPTLYQAEGYGMLPILQFVKQLLIYCQATPTWSCALTSDNISLRNKAICVNDKAHPSNKPIGDQPHDWSIWKESDDHDLKDPIGNSPTTTTLEPDGTLLTRSGGCSKTVGWKA